MQYNLLSHIMKVTNPLFLDDLRMNLKKLNEIIRNINIYTTLFDKLSSWILLLNPTTF